MSSIDFVDLSPGDYDRAKSVLNKAKHPGFVGRELFFRCATTGKATVAVVDGTDSAVMLVAKNRIEALSVIVAAQGRGIGQALVQRARPRFVNAIGDRIGFFEKLGYKPVGAAKVGQNGKHSTQLMQLDEALENAPAGEVAIKDATPGALREDGKPAQQVEVPSFAKLAQGQPVDRIDAELELLDKLLLQAVASERYDAVLKLTERVEYLSNQRRRC